MFTNTPSEVREAVAMQLPSEEAMLTWEASLPYVSLVGDKVNDSAVVECLNELELKWLERFETEVSRGKTTTPEDKYQIGAAQQYKGFAGRVESLRDNLQKGGLSNLDGYNSRDLYETLETAEVVLKAKSDATREIINLSGLEDYKSKVEAHWKDELAKTSTTK